MACWAPPGLRPATCWFGAPPSTRSAGFAQGIRSGGDIELARRLAAAGWTVEHRPAAIVTHRHREDLPSFLGMIARYGAGARWLNARYPGSSPRWPLGAGLASTARDVAALGIRGRFEQALFRALDGAGLVAHNLGYVTSNSAPRTTCGGLRPPDQSPPRHSVSRPSIRG